MKLAIHQLETQLNKEIAPIYLISSDEVLLAQEAATLIYQSAKRLSFLEKKIITADNNEWVKTFYSHAHSTSLFSEKQCIELNLSESKLTATTSKALQEYLEKPQADILLIIRTNKIDSKTEKSAWFQKFEKSVVFIPIWPISPAQLPRWILQRSQKMGLHLSNALIDLIANQVEGNLLAAAQEIEKLHLLQLSSPLNEEDVFSALTDNTHYTIFDLVENVIADNKQRSLRILNNLKDEDTEPTLILWALTREFRMLAEMAIQKNRGVSLNNLFTQFRIFEKRQPSIRSFLQTKSLTQCYDLLLKAAHIDRVIKGNETGDTWIEIEKLITSPACGE